jgi:hypothetical protein
MRLMRRWIIAALAVAAARDIILSIREAEDAWQHDRCRYCKEPVSTR